MKSVTAAIKCLMDAVQLTEPSDKLPVVIWASSPFISHFKGLTYSEYYQSPKKMLDAQISVIRRFPNAHIYGIYPDFGLVMEPSAFGCKAKFPVDGPPWITDFALKKIEDVKKMKIPDPHKSGLMAEAMKIYKYMVKRLKKELPDYPLDHTWGIIRGPFTVATLTRGYDAFIRDLYTKPDLAHELLRIIMDVLIDFYRSQEEIAGSLSRIILCDDNTSWLSPKLASEFSFRYMREIFRKFRKPLRLYHNDANATHLLDLIRDCGANAFNVGKVVKIEDVTEKLGGKIAILGNVDPVETLLNGTPLDVESECRHCIEVAGLKPGFVLCPGGVLAPYTPQENIEAMIRSAWKPKQI